MVIVVPSEARDPYFRPRSGACPSVARLRTLHRDDKLAQDSGVLAPRSEPLGISRAQLLFIQARDFGKWNADAVGDDRQAPQRVAELLRDGVLVERALLHHMLASVTQDLAAFLRKARGRVEKTLPVREGKIDRTRSCMLIGVKRVLSLHE